MYLVVALHFVHTCKFAMADIGFHIFCLGEPYFWFSGYPIVHKEGGTCNRKNCDDMGNIFCSLSKMKPALNSLCTTLRCAATLQLKKTKEIKIKLHTFRGIIDGRGIRTERSYKGGCETKISKLPAKRICHRQVAKRRSRKAGRAGRGCRISQGKWKVTC